MGIRQAFTSYSNPEGNADTERVLRTLKEELVWPREWTNSGSFFAALDRWITDKHQLPAFGARLPSAECRRSLASRPRHSLSRSLLNGVQHTALMHRRARDYAELRCVAETSNRLLGVSLVNRRAPKATRRGARYVQAA
jgi:hypothetical protein